MRERHRWIVDRFEGDTAVVEVDGERFVDLPRWALPPRAREGDAFLVMREPAADGTTVVLTVRFDPRATEDARAEALRLVERLRRKDPGGDVVL